MQDLDKIIEPTECELLVAFTDLTGFAKEFQRRSDSEMFAFMAQFYEWTENVVQNSGGKRIKFMGDAILLVYPADNARQGVEALRTLKSEGDSWLKEREFVGELRVRIHIGSLVCGPLGARGNKRFDVMGKVVNATALMRSDGFTLSAELEQRINL